MVVMSNHLTSEAVKTVAQKILDNLSLPYQVGGHTLHSTPSIGISRYPQDATEVEELMQHADLAMYQVKQAGRGEFRLYEGAATAESIG